MAVGVRVRFSNSPIWACGAKAVLKPPHSKRFAQCVDVRWSRSVWSACASAPLSDARFGQYLPHVVICSIHARRVGKVDINLPVLNRATYETLSRTRQSLVKSLTRQILLRSPICCGHNGSGGMCPAGTWQAKVFSSTRQRFRLRSFCGTQSRGPQIRLPNVRRETPVQGSNKERGAIVTS
jgi:hypothetical protein